MIERKVREAIYLRTPITGGLLKKLGVTQKCIDVFLPYLAPVALEYDVDTPQRIAAFLGQVLHESGHLKYVREIWGPTSSQKRYERDMKAHWTNKGANSLAFMLGNSQPGDGKFYKGRGLIQITGRTNYKHCSLGLFGDDRLMKNPELLESPEYAVRSAFWYCHWRNVFEKFDTPSILDETKAINGGTNGLAERQKIYDLTIQLLG